MPPEQFIDPLIFPGTPPNVWGHVCPSPLPRGDRIREGLVYSLCLFLESLAPGRAAPAPDGMCRDTVGEVRSLIRRWLRLSRW